MRRLRTPLLALASVAVLGASLATLARAGGTDSQMPNGWKITPAGRQVDVMRFPLGMAASSDQSKIVVTSNSGGPQFLNTIDTATMSSVPSTINANLFMGVAVAADGRVFASGGNADRVFRFRMAGPTVVPLDATEAGAFPSHHILDTATQGQNLPASDGLRVTGYPGNMLLDGNLLYVTGTLSEKTAAPASEVCPSGQPACSRITIIDTSANGGLGAVAGRAPVGFDAYAMALDPVRHRLYVSNWADEAGRGGAPGGTVSVVDVTNPASPHEIAFTRVGHHPSAVQLSADRSRLFVANTNDDTFSVLDVATDAPTVVRTESVKAIAGPVGAHPNAFALSPDGRTLFVALAGTNAIEVRNGRTGARFAGKPLYIPTGWYPASLLVTGNAQHYRLWVVNMKGRGFGPGYNLSVGADGSQPGSLESTLQDGGSVSSIDLPVSDQQVAAWTRQVAENDQFANAQVDPCKPTTGIRVSEVLCPPSGKRSPVKHVLYVVTENKTFDQYFGDIGLTGKNKGYDADPTYALYGQPFTPNHHALADRYSLGDRFFSDAEVSVTGHSWTAGAIATDHNEKTFQADYDQGLRGTHGGGDPLRPSVGSPAADKAISAADDKLQDPVGGYIFEAFKRAGAKPPSDTSARLTMGIYGERTAIESGDMSAYQAKWTKPDGTQVPWKDGDIQYFDTCRAGQFINGQTGGGTFPDNQGPGGVTIQDCEKRGLDPQFTLKHWTDVYNQTHRDVMPNFIYMSLPVNHTLGTNLGSPTPASMVADNDYAVGQIVEALSKSPFWQSTVVMQTEDDTQAAGDHISPLRDYLAVSGPWAQPGPNHQWGSMPALLRTIETIFSVKPVSLYDKLALPMQEAFRASLKEAPDTGVFTAVKPLIPFAINQPGAPSQSLSMAQNWSTSDKVDMQILNKILYEAQGKAPPAG